MNDLLRPVLFQSDMDSPTSLRIVYCRGFPCSIHWVLNGLFLSVGSSFCQDVEIYGGKGKNKERWHKSGFVFQGRSEDENEAVLKMIRRKKRGR